MDPQLMNFMSMFTKELLKPDGSAAAGGMDKMMQEFTSFLKSSEGDPEMKGALEQVVSELLNKDTLYEPMRVMRDEYPGWLEANWQRVSQKQLEQYNEQLDKITEICAFYEAKPTPEQQTQAFELLHQLQELGSPPEELMQKIQAKQMGSAGGGGGLF
jgi:peroxin-19